MLRIHSWETMSANDGPGIRTVFFLQGCNFRCWYCHNPDTQELKSGQFLQTEEVIEILKKNIKYYGEDGGVTFSGGEPLLQAEALLEVMTRIKEELKISVVIDTNGSALMPAAKKVVVEANLVIFDLKEIDSQKHKQLTGWNNQLTIETIEMREKAQQPFWLRYVLVPGITDDADDLKKWGELTKKWKCLKKVEILPYHTLGVPKYKALGESYKLEGVREASQADVARAVALMKVARLTK